MSDSNESLLHVIKDKNDFEKMIQQNKGKYVVLDFFAYWCGPCIQIEDDEKELSEKLKKQNVEFIRVDCDNTDTQYLMQVYRVLCAPTFVLTKDRAKLGIVIGAKLDKVQTLLDKYLKPQEK